MCTLNTNTHCNKQLKNRLGQYHTMRLTITITTITKSQQSVFPCEIRAEAEETVENRGCSLCITDDAKTVILNLGVTDPPGARAYISWGPWTWMDKNIKTYFSVTSN